MTTASVVGPGAVAAPELANPYLSGQMLRADGSPPHRATVAVAALHDLDNGIQIVEPLVSDATDKDGYWQVSHPDSLPTEAFSSIEVTAVVDGKPIIYNYLLPEVEGGADLLAAPRVSRTITTGRRSLPAVDAEPLVMQVGEGRVQPDATDTQVLSMTSSASTTEEQSLVAAPEQTEPDDDVTGPEDAPEMGGETILGSSTCASTYTFWVNRNKYKASFAPLKTSRTLGHSKLHYHYKSTKKTELQVAITGSGGKYAGGLTGSQSEITDTGVSPDWPHNTAKLVKAKWRYRKQRKWCHVAGPTGPESEPMDIYRWVPNKFLLYTKPVENNPTFACHTKGPIHSDTTFTNTATVKWLAWFSIATVKLDNSQTQSTVTGVTIDPDAGETARYCGSNSNGLDVSAFIREIPKA